MPTDLQEALTAASASALIQKQIDPVLLEYQRRYAPLVRSLPAVKWGSNVYYFNRRTSMVPGGFVTDGGARPVGTSVYEQNQFTIRNLQAVGAVTGYAQQVTADLIGDLRAREIKGAAQGLLWDIETGLDWGNSAATQYGPYPQFDGFDQIASIFSGGTQNAIDEAGGNFTLGTLDNLIDLVEQNVSEPVDNSEWMFVMSPTANSRMAQLLLSQQRFNDVVEVEAGLIVPTYRNVPVVKSSFLSPRTQVMSSIATSVVDSGGALAAATYYYRVSAIMSRFGETQACAEVDLVVADADSIATIAFTAPTGPENANPILYKVFRSTTTGTETLLGYVDAIVGLNTDGVSPIYANNIVDNGTQLIPQLATGPVQPAQTPAAYVGTNAGIKPLSAGWQNIYLMSRNSDYVVRPYVRDMQTVNIYPTTASPDSLPFAFVSDTTLAVRAPKYMGRAANTVVQLTA